VNGPRSRKAPSGYAIYVLRALLRQDATVPWISGVTGFRFRTGARADHKPAGERRRAQGAGSPQSAPRRTMGRVPAGDPLPNMKGESQWA
jgi:hypothetical protein